MDGIDIWLLPISFLTSTLAAVVGFGGGMLLIGALPWLLPAQAIIPVHGVTQLASNASRAWFSRRAILWGALLPFLLGSLLGIGVCALVFSVALPTRWLPLIIGMYILATLWCKPVDVWLRRYESFYSAGFFQSGLGIIVGATGPLTTNLMLRQTHSKDAMVATNALLMLVSHLLKLMIFGVLGFAFRDYLLEMGLLIAGAVGGSWAGTALRAQLKAERFTALVRGLLTVLAGAMCLKPWL